MHLRKLLNFKMNMNDSIQGHATLLKNLLENLSSNSYPRSVVKRFILFELLIIILSVHLSIHQYLFNTNFRGFSCFVLCPLNRSFLQH